MFTFAFFKKNAELSKWSFIVILQFFLLIIMAVWNIKQTIMKDYNIQSCQWMACDRFRQPTQDHNVGYVKNVYLQHLVVDWISMLGCSKVQYEGPFFVGSVSVSFGLSNKSGLGKSTDSEFHVYFWRLLICRWTLYKADISMKRALMSCANGVHFIERFHSGFLKDKLSLTKDTSTNY